MMGELEHRKHNIPARSSQRLFMALGVLWLLLGTAVVVSQLGGPAAINIEWATETEVNTAGFNIYRSESADGEYIRLNSQLVPARGSAMSGSSYQFVDENVEPGQTYFYRLEDVELDNSTHQHPLLEYTAPHTPWWLPVTAAFSLLCGALLLVKGLRSENRR